MLYACGCRTLTFNRQMVKLHQSLVYGILTNLYRGRYMFQLSRISRMQHVSLSHHIDVIDNQVCTLSSRNNGRHSQKQPIRPGNLSIHGTCPEARLE